MVSLKLSDVRTLGWHGLPLSHGHEMAAVALAITLTVFKGKQQGRTQGNSFSTTFQRNHHSLHPSLQLIGGIQSHPIPRPRARAPCQRSQHLPSGSQSSPAPTAETPPCIQDSLEALGSPQAVLRGRTSSKPNTCCSWAPTRPVPEL